MSIDEAGASGPADRVAPLYDSNLFCGHYPFRRLPAGTPQSLAGFAKTANLSGAVLTSFESIFYRQPLEGLKPWLEAQPALQFQPRYWLVINPLMPGWIRDIAFAAETPSIAGLRLFPRYHGYGLNHAAVRSVATAASDFKLPINLSARLLDDRLHPHPLRVDAPLKLDDVRNLLEDTSGTAWVLSMFYMGELKTLASLLHKANTVFVDIGCSKPFEFWEDDIRALAPISQVIYGSGAPLYYHLGGRISLQRFSYSAEDKAAICGGNLHRLLQTAAAAQVQP